MLARTRTSLLALLCATALIAGACGGSSSTAIDSADETNQDDAANRDAGDEGTAVETPAPTSDSTASTDSSGSSESPLGDLLGIPLTDDAAADEYFTELSRKAEVKIAECMLGQGFEYKVVDVSQFAGVTNVDFETREFAEQYGFGIASNPFEESFEAFESFTDPNQEYIESLSEGERDAYQSALSGQLPDADPGALQSFEPGGCQGEAFDELFAFGRVFEQFGNEFQEIEEAYYADPRIVAATSGWSTCMGEAGYSFSDQDGAEQDVQRRYDEMVRDPDAFASDEELFSDSGADGEEVFVFGPQQLTPEVQAQVDELAIEERAIGLASWECNGPLREIEDEVRIEYEQRFVDENGAAIQAVLDE